MKLPNDCDIRADQNDRERSLTSPAVALRLSHTYHFSTRSTSPQLVPFSIFCIKLQCIVISIVTVSPRPGTSLWTASGSWSSRRSYTLTSRHHRTYVLPAVASLRFPLAVTALISYGRQGFGVRTFVAALSQIVSKSRQRVVTPRASDSVASAVAALTPRWWWAAPARCACVALTGINVVAMRDEARQVVPIRCQGGMCATTFIHYLRVTDWS